MKKVILSVIFSMIFSSVLFAYRTEGRHVQGKAQAANGSAVGEVIS